MLAPVGAFLPFFGFLFWGPVFGGVTEGGRALVSPIHAFLRSRINLLDLISSSPLFYDIFLKGIVMVDRFCSVKNCCSECDLLVVCARQAAICAAVGCAPEVPEMLLDTRA